MDEDFWHLLVISEDGAFSLAWVNIDIVMCVATSYFYVLMATFGDEEREHSFEFFIFDFFFTLDMAKNFLTDFKPPGEDIRPVRDLKKIADNYLRGNFLRDFIMWAPAYRFLVPFSPDFRLLLFIKSYRVVKGFAIFNVSRLMAHAKRYLIRKSSARCREDLDHACDQLEDHNKVSTLIYIQYALTTLKLVIQIFNTSFYAGVLWHVYCDYSSELTRSAEGFDPGLPFASSPVNN